MAHYVVIRSELIESAEEAKNYYVERIAGSHMVECHGKSVAIFFERSASHMFSEEMQSDEVVLSADLIVRRIRGGVIERRRFCLDRARLMDRAIEAIAQYTVSIPATGRWGADKTMLHGPRLSDGRYLRVVLRHGGPADFVCVSSYPVSERVWLDARRARSARSPP